MSEVVNSNCRKCPYYQKGSCTGKDQECICKYCPRNISMCIITKWCRETESQILFEDETDNNQVQDF